MNKAFRRSMEELEQKIEDRNPYFTMLPLFEILSDICGASDKPVVLMIDEVDSAANNEVFLASRLCKLMDEDIDGNGEFETESTAWTKRGFYEAVRMILIEKNTLFESLISKLTDYPDLNLMLRSLLFTGKSIAYN